MEITAAKTASGVLRGPRRGKREEMGPEARLSCVYILRGSESGRVPILPCLPPPTPSFPPSFALLASATPCVSGQISPTVGSAGLCGGLFILERGLPSGSLHLSKHPPGRCSVFPALHSLPPPPPPPPSPPPASLSHTLFLLYHSFTSGPLRHPVKLSIFSIFSLTLSFLSQSVFPLSLRAPSSIAAFSHDSVSVALSPLTLS